MFYSGMENNIYSLTWPRFGDSLKELCQELLIDEEGKDVTLVFDDQSRIKVHRLILMFGSQVFRNTRISPNAEVRLPGVKILSMIRILQFLYLGQTTLQEDQLQDFLAAVNMLKIRELYTEEVKNPTEENPHQQVKPESTPSNFDFSISSEDISKSFKTVDPKHHGEVSKKDPIAAKSSKVKRQTGGRNYQNQSAGGFPCNKCKFVASDQKGFWRHYALDHQGVIVSWHYCSFAGCIRKFNKKEKLEDHQRINNHQPDGKPLICNRCPYTTVSADALKNHIEVIHNHNVEQFVMTFIK